MTHYSGDDSLDRWDWERIPADVDAVLFKWLKAVRESAPWCAMPADDAIGHMRPIVSELLNEAHHPSDGRHTLRLSAAARTHGGFRRRQHCEWPVVAAEIDVLMGAFRAAMVDAKQPPGLVRDSLVVIEAELRLVHEFALLGWEDMSGRVSLAT